MPLTFKRIAAEHAAANQSLPPRRVWEEQRIRALGEAIVRRMGHEEPMVASVFDLAHVHDWAAEIVELCERNGGQQAKPSDAKEVPDAPKPNPEPTSTTERLVGLIRDRHAKGLAKYGTTLDRADLSPEDWAQHAIEEALDLAGYLMHVKDGFATQPGSMAARHVEILRTRVNVLEALVEARGKAVTDAHVANHAMSQDLALALQLGDALRQAMRTGKWRPGNDRGMANNAMAGWDRFRPSLGKALSASEAPGDGRDGDRKRKGEAAKQEDKQ